MVSACGLDFGTSNSTVGWCQHGKATLLALEEGKLTLPSVVFFNVEDDSVSFGRAALAEYLAGYEGRMMRSLKSLLGSNLIDGQTEVGGKIITFRLLLAQFIKELKRRAELAAGHQFSNVVMGRPVYFVDGNADADRLAEKTLSEIASAAGFKNVVFQYEPIAAAFDYEATIQKEELVLIVDIGGGTSDFSLVRLSPDRAAKNDRRDDILATGGVHIGGTDFDKYFSLSSVMPLFGLGTQLRNNTEVPSSYYFNLATWHTINLAYTKKVQAQLADVAQHAKEPEKLGRLLNLVEQRAGHWLALKVEEAKIALSDAESVELALDRLSPQQNLSLNRQQFDDSIAHLISKIETTVTGMLNDAGVSADAVDTVFFTGGSSGVHLLREKIAAMVPSARRVEGDLFGSIGSGLAIDAARLFGH
ncbi:Hsp70 family protein [Solimicrobium silvestre]|uniref:Hsp70 protein n=1 Tax=Solimicrobium silvestre TaxID=2099400 RepID=A0A2S9H4K0_9BURK|nr:Hsp70 family protein [Solimicrobium silvestre]PRC94873.1 Hsp70 protein [Solimicrobium silvestre]